MISLQSFSTGVLAEIVRRQPASKQRTAFAWQLAVGPAVARATTVELSDRGVLSVGAIDQRWVVEIDRARDTVLLKMQQLLGRDQVTKIQTRRVHSESGTSNPDSRLERPTR